MMNKYWFVFCKTDLLLEKNDDGTLSVPFQEKAPIKTRPWTTIHNISPFPDADVKTYCIDNPITENDKYVMMGLRATYDHIPIELYLKAGKCAEILYWDSTTKFCGVCGGQMKLHTDISKRCENCGKEVWPQLATAIIVLVNKGDEVLLVHANNFRGNYFGLVAGFVETGETLEQAVHREVLEETGIKVKNLRYHGSQPWPYPCGLMVGFFAEYESGSIKLQRSEIGAGDWFNRDNFPEIPGKMSMARMLIDKWLESSAKNNDNK
jgi:NAD+ diphosphatase